MPILVIPNHKVVSHLIICDQLQIIIIDSSRWCQPMKWFPSSYPSFLSYSLSLLPNALLNPFHKRRKSPSSDKIILNLSVRTEIDCSIDLIHLFVKNIISTNYNFKNSMKLVVFIFGMVILPMAYLIFWAYFNKKIEKYTHSFRYIHKNLFKTRYDLLSKMKEHNRKGDLDDS